MTPVDAELEEIGDAITLLYDKTKNGAKRSAYTDVLIIIARRQLIARKEHR